MRVLAGSPATSRSAGIPEPLSSLFGQRLIDALSSLTTPGVASQPAAWHSNLATWSIHSSG
eukprot:2470382-Prymnesium_polylepis.1